jgi:FAD/FMN-containing dehydrogenase
MKSEIELTGRVIYFEEPGYHNARMDFNRRFSKYPLVIVFCQEVADVINAICWARGNGIPIRIRSGRHSFEAFSLVNGGLIIDVSELNEILIDREKKIVKIGAGAQLLPLYQQLFKAGLTIPGGTCPTVGIAGLTLGGGFGMLTRWLGMLCDHLVSMRMVTAEGKVITADKCNHNPDLFWASCGGGGGNFGVMTSFTFEAFPVSEVAIFNIVWDWTESMEVIKAWQEWAPFVDDRLTSIIRLFTPKTGRIIAAGEFVGSQAELHDLLEPILAIGHPTAVDLLTVPYIEAVRTFGGIGPLAVKFGITESKPVNSNTSEPMCFKSYRHRLFGLCLILCKPPLTEPIRSNFKP